MTVHLTLVDTVKMVGSQMLLAVVIRVKNVLQDGYQGLIRDITARSAQMEHTLFKKIFVCHAHLVHSMTVLPMYVVLALMNTAPDMS